MKRVIVATILASLASTAYAGQGTILMVQGKIFKADNGDLIVKAPQKQVEILVKTVDSDDIEVKIEDKTIYSLRVSREKNLEGVDNEGNAVSIIPE
jgi:hypothetical protein